MYTTSDQPTTPVVLSARNVVKTYGTGHVAVEALRGIDLDIRAGEMTTIMGPSGNGKTTLLNCCSGLDDIDSGSIEIDGVDIASLTDVARSELRAMTMGFVFQSFNLIGVLNAVENVEVPLLLQGTKPRAARRLATDMIERVGLGERHAHIPAELSGGEQQRVAIARALVAKPRIVWADEPTGALDSETAASILELLGEVHRDGQALVIVTHDPTIGRSGQRLVTVRNGLIESDERLSA